MSHLIYIAGPLFTHSERQLLEQIDQVCHTCGYRTFLPHRDAGLFVRDDRPSRVFFDNDILKLNQSQLIIAVLNGSDVDSGTSWEMGYAFATKKPIIGYLSDIRIFDPAKQLNAMIFNSSVVVLSNLEELGHQLINFRQSATDVS